MMDKMRMHALISQLTADGDAFDGPAADRLIAALPVTGRSRWWSIGGALRRGGRGDRAALAAGPAGDKGQGLVEFGGRSAHRVGLYAIEHVPGQLRIRSVVSKIGEDGDAARIVYTRGRAERMDLSAVSCLRLGPVALELATWRSWKIRAE